jgi:O-antigen/teichoic acid export membrane protein
LVLCIYDIPCGAANLPGAEITPVSLLSSLKKYRPEISRKTWQIFRIGFPLGLVAALGALRISIPSYFIERFLGLRELGIFAGINTFLNGFFFMQVAVGTASLPRLAKYNAGGFRRKYWRLALGIVGLGIFVSASLVLVAMFFGETVLELVYGLEYLGFSSLFILLSVVALLKCVGGSLQFILASMRIFSYHLPVTSVGVFTNFLFSIIWIPVYGLSAAAYAMIIGSFVIMLLYLFAILRSELSNKVSIHESRSQIH